MWEKRPEFGPITALDVMVIIGVLIVLLLGSMHGSSFDQDEVSAAQPARSPAPGEFRGLTVPQVIDEMNRRGHNSPPDVLVPDL